MSTPTGTGRLHATAAPGPRVRVVAYLVVAWCLGFAVANVVLELGDRFAEGPYADYAAGLAVVGWLVVGLKVLGAGVALLTLVDVAGRPADRIAALAWGATATLGLYTVGSLVQLAGMLTGVAGDAGDVDAAGIAYVAFFLVGAVSFAILAVSHTRRHAVRPRVAVVGSCAGPVVLAGVLVAAPALLAWLDVMPAPR